MQSLASAGDVHAKLQTISDAKFALPTGKSTSEWMASTQENEGAIKSIGHDAAAVEAAFFTTPSARLSNSRSPGPYRGKCLYQSRKCENERAVKRNGSPHNLCDAHRTKQNKHQRKFDAKKCYRKRHRDIAPDDDENADKYARREQELSAMHHRPIIKLDAEVNHSSEAAHRTPVYTRTASHPATACTPVLTPFMRLPPISSRVLAPSPAGWDTSSDLLKKGMRSEDFEAGPADLSLSRQQPMIMNSGPYLPRQVTQPSSDYTYSELVAACTLVRPQHFLDSGVASHSMSHRDEILPSGEDRSHATTTPYLLPSLVGSPTFAPSRNSYTQVGGVGLPLPQRFELSVPSARSIGRLRSYTKAPVSQLSFPMGSQE
ncbi:hypothetical protein CCR75_008564 [Bremia lactucae]|uniref:Uncharacterized protein n=1 Tax=Bremia lactucae TaxID=4779 RepID=A0A976FHJ8_BRELC|nr:hypothetical protein CCR75_008564 [Bremia lactucae]